jgi:serine/threonine protein kinase
MQDDQPTGPSPSGQLITELRDRFERDWLDGNQPGLESVVVAAPESVRAELFRHLLNVECQHRARSRRPLDLAEAQQRFRTLGPWTEAIVLELLGNTGTWVQTFGLTPATGPSDLPTADPRPPQPGPPRIGQYELLTTLGHGGSGAVFKARHAQLKRVVALKVLLPHRALASDGLERFRIEMEVLGRLNHPNIIRATDAGEVEGYLYLAMEYVEGIDLGRILKRFGRLDVADACELVRQTAEALACLDSHGLAHRDVKPNNLLLGRDGVLRVLDMGLAQLRDAPRDERLTETGAVMGTPEFIAPEQARESRNVNIRADVYSLGCTLFALLTGTPPFPRTGSMYDLFRAHNETPPPALTTVRPDAPPELAQLIARMLEKDPAQRPVPADVARALAPFCQGSDLVRLAREAGPTPETSVVLPASSVRLAFNGGPTATPPPPEPTTVLSAPPVRAAGRRKRWVLTAAAVLVLGGVVWALWPPKKAHPEPDPEPVPRTLPGVAVVPVPGPRTFAPGKSTQLIDREPVVKRVWPKDNARGLINFDPANKQLFVSCPDYGAVELECIEARAYDAEVKIFLSDWSVGRVGVFFRGQGAPDARGQYSWHADELYIPTLEPVGKEDKPADPDTVKEVPAPLKRRTIGVFADTGGLSSDNPCTYNIRPRPFSGDHTLSFTVGPDGVSAIRWDGRDAVPVAVRPGWREPVRESANGGFGVVVSNGSALFRSIQIRPHPPTQE